MFRLDPGGDRWKRWISGQEALGGHHCLETEESVRLQGTLSGRCLLALRAPSVELRSLRARVPGDHLILAVDRGEVVVSGTVEASLILTGQARRVMEDGAILAGSLYLLNDLQEVRPGGRIQPTASGRNTRDFTDGNGERGIHAIDFSPEPIGLERLRGGPRSDP